VILDLRKNSKTYKKWLGRRLNETNKKLLIIPRGCAHGFLTLKKNTLVTYYVSNFYNPKMEKGIKYNDKSFKIKWPSKIRNISEKDNSWKIFK
jgi:dTDP-4-dehydrorhamnose 3,5-epimerase